MADAGLPGKGRIEALTDGIFAVAMTLLVLDLRLPETLAAIDDAGLRKALLALLPKLESYVISFLVLCIFWLGHHRLMHLVRGVDHLFLWRNLLFILFITFVPFSTSLMGQYRSLDDAPLVYGVNLGLVLAAQFLMWRHALFHLSDAAQGEVAARWRAVRDRYVIAFTIVAAAVLLAALDWRFAAYLYLLLVFVGPMRPKPALAH
ncbi:MAG TPA: TMEM175 family protein [Burkholderiales bacterium]|nr:TMEM175 family protein [Burkholderiales bacterium]